MSKIKRNAFTNSAYLNNMTYLDYLNRLRRIALARFKWKNLPDTMNERKLEKDLFEKGIAAILKDEKRGIINTGAASSGMVDIYGIPTKINCFSYNFQDVRNTYLYDIDKPVLNQAILVMNDWDMTPTYSSLELFAWRLYNCDRIIDININAQKTPVVIIADDTSRLTMENLMLKYDGNQPFIFGDKNNFDLNNIKALNTSAPFVADKVQKQKKEIWNEALTYLGINNMSIDKKERAIIDEVNENNELINLNLQSFMIPRMEACEKMNSLFKLEGEAKVSIELRSDLANVIKKESSIVNDYNITEGDENE